MRTVGLIVQTVAVLAITAAAAEIEVPLRYEGYREQVASLWVKSVKVAGFDMLAEPGREPPVFIEFGEADASRGIRLSALPAGGGEDGMVEKDGVPCRFASAERAAQVHFEVDNAWRPRSGDAYVLVEYLDAGAERISILYMTSIEGDELRFRQAGAAADIDASGAWRRHQFFLENAAFGEDGAAGPFDFAVSAGFGRIHRPTGRASIALSLTPPPGPHTFPEFRSRRPLYGKVDLGDEARILAFDSSVPDTMWDTLYFDRDGDGNLGGEEAVAAETGPGSPDYHWCRFPPADTEVARGDRRLPYRFGVQMYAPGIASIGGWEGLTEETVARNVHATLVSQCCYSGEFEWQGRAYQLKLNDGNANGTFSDRLRDIRRYTSAGIERFHASGDHLYLRASAPPAYDDGMILGDLLALGADVFGVRVDETRSRLVLTPVTDGLFPLVPGMAVSRMSLYTDGFARCVMAVDPPGAIPLPAGAYRLLSYAAVRADDRGSVWRLNAVATADSPEVALNDASGAALPLGEPFVPGAGVDPWQREAVGTGSRREISLQFHIRGQGGECVSGLRRVEGRETSVPLSAGTADLPKEPSYRIVKEDGEVVASGSFEYG